MPRHDADLYDYLATSKVSDVTIAQLEQALENSFINKTNIEFWKGPITVHRLLEVSRTYPWGLPVPEAGAVGTVLIDPIQSGVIQPPGTEIWDIKHIRGQGAGATATAIISFSDGTTDAIIYEAASFPTAGANVDLNSLVSAPILLTNSLYLKFTETGAAAGMALTVAYQVVGK